MTPTEIKSIMQSIDSRPIKALGQNFLIDQAALQDIIQAAEIKQGEHVLEIGPGLGVLTKELISSGAKVTAIEKDRRLASYLFKLLSPATVGERSSTKVGGVEGVVGDAAKLDWDKLIGKKPWKFVSNLPYSITSFALRKALYSSTSPDNVVVLVQREVAERILMRDGKMSLLALMVGLSVGTGRDLSVHDRIQIIRRVPPGAFFPPPKVESAILRIVPMSHETRREVWGIDPEEVMAVAKKGFAHPRKLLQRNLQVESSKWQALSARIGFNIKARPEELSVQQWVELTKRIQNS